MRFIQSSAAKGGWFGVLLSALSVSWLPSMVSAQSNVDDWMNGPAHSQCLPECRRGYECTKGECLPVCSPPCAAGSHCVQGGICIGEQQAAAPFTPPPPDVRPREALCYPSCRSGYVCLDGQCVSACNPVCGPHEQCAATGECIVAQSAPQSVAASPAPEPVRGPHEDSVANLHIDALGALQFGLTPTVEFGKKVSGYVRLRAMNTGLMSYLLVDMARDDHFRWGLGAAAGMHVFSAGRGNMRGLFGGPGFEYLFMRTRDSTVLETNYGVHVLVPQVDLGYRWGFGRFLLGIGGRVGVYIPVRTRVSTSGGFGCDNLRSCDPGGLNNIHAALGVFLDLGWFL